MRFLRIGLSVVAALGLVFVTTPVSAGAQDDVEMPEWVDIDLYWDTLVHIVDELAHLTVLDRVAEPVPEFVQGLPREWGIHEAPAGVYEEVVTTLDTAEGPRLLERFHDRGLPASDSTVQVLRTAAPGPVDADTYLQAYDDAMWQWWFAGGRDWGLGAAPLGELLVPSWLDDNRPPPVLEPVDWSGELPPSEPDPAQVAPTEPADIGAIPESPEVELDRPPETDRPIDPVAAESDRPEPETDTGPGVSIAVGGIAVLALGVVGFLRLRRPRSAAPTQIPAADLLESGRRFLATTSVDALGAQVAESARRLSGGTGAVFTTDEGSWASGVQPEFPDDLVERVRATGKTSRTDDRALVAVLSAGRVVGVIGVAGSGSRTSVVEQLAPLAGEGLANLIKRAEAEQLAFVDALTAVPNRRRFDLDLGHHSRLAAGEARAVAVAMVDVDHFKAYNDTNGHQEGDEALRTIARLISGSLRTEDTVYRYGGEEFAVLLPGADLEAARGVAERIRHAVESHDFAGGPGQPGGQVTVSIGVSTSPPPDGEIMLEAADAALYRAKHLGRNRVVLAAEPA